MPKEVWNVAGQFSWHEYEEPVLGAGEVRIRSQFSAAKHGTELAFWHNGHGGRRGRFDQTLQVFLTDAPPEPPLPPGGQRPKLAGGGVGNMTVGAVMEVGPGVKTLAVGDRVLIYGGFRQTHARAETRCWKIAEDMPWQSAVCLDPADFAFSAVRDGHVRVGDVVAILGMGAIGLVAVQIARAAGAGTIIASEPVAARRELAARLGAAVVLDPHACDAGLEIKKATGGRGADVVIDYSGSADALQDALRGVAFGGTVVAGAFPAPYPAGLDLGAEAHMNIPQIVFSRACSEPNRDYPRWNEERIVSNCLRMLREGTINGTQIVRPVVEFEEALMEYPKIATCLDTHVKLGIKY